VRSVRPSVRSSVIATISKDNIAVENRVSSNIRDSVTLEDNAL
jgi:hypothetical protein